MTTLKYDEKDLVWLLTAVDDDTDLWLQFKSQHNSDIYFIDLPIEKWVKIQMKLSQIRHIIGLAGTHSLIMSLNDQMSDLNKIEQSITVTINKVGVLF